jgi:predicted DNA-binding transcriptional regulator AlpA
MARDLSEVRFLTVAEVADMMRVSKMTVYRLVHAGEPESAVVAAIDTPISDVG